MVPARSCGRALLGVLRRANQSELFGVPECERDRALGLPAVASKFTECSRDFEQRRRAGAGIDAAERPRVVVCAEQNAAIRPSRARHACDDVANRRARRSSARAVGRVTAPPPMR